MRGIDGWLLVYLIGSVPVGVFYAAALSGWVYDYPLPLFAGIAALLAVPLVMLLLSSPIAPAVNIGTLALAGSLVVARVATGATSADPDRLTTGATSVLIAVAVFAIAWAAAWILFFLRSTKVAELFG